MIYLDNNATTPVDPEVLEAMMPFFSEHFGNSASLHSLGEGARDAILQSRTALGRLLGARAADFVLTSGATEAANLAIFGAADAYPDRKHIVVTAIEHPAVLRPIAALEARGYSVTRIGVDTAGQVNVADIEAAISDDTLMVAAMMANNQTGVILPAAEIGQVCRDRDVLYLCDACQAVGKIPVNVRELRADFLVLSAHKFHGPKGVGALYVRPGTGVVSQILGGGHQSGRRAGTENVPSVVGMGMAAYTANALLKAKAYDAVAERRDRFEAAILSAVDGAMVHGAGQPRLPGSLNVSFEHASGEAALQLLDERGVAASSSSACRSNETKPSHVLEAMEVPETYIHGSIRFGLSRHTTDADLDKVVAMLPRVIAAARRASPFVERD